MGFLTLLFVVNAILTLLSVIAQCKYLTNQSVTLINNKALQQLTQLIKDKIYSNIETKSR